MGHAFGVYAKGSRYQRKFKAYQAARRKKANVKLEYQVVVVGKKHCKMEPTYHIEKPHGAG